MSVQILILNDKLPYSFHNMFLLVLQLLPIDCPKWYYCFLHNKPG